MHYIVLLTILPLAFNSLTYIFRVAPMQTTLQISASIALSILAYNIAVTEASFFSSAPYIKVIKCMAGEFVSPSIALIHWHAVFNLN